MLSTIVIMTKSARLSQKKTLPPKRCVTGVSLHCQDQSGYISLDELLNGYDKLPEFQEQMRLMDVEREDMQLGYTIAINGVGHYNPYKWPYKLACLGSTHPLWSYKLSLITNNWFLGPPCRMLDCLVHWFDPCL